MSANDKRKTLLERIVESLPDQLRQAYEAAPRKGSEAHEILRLFVAKYLWDNGFRSISFEKSVPNGRENMCIDIYEERLVLFVECERQPERKAVIERLKRLKDAYPTAKFVLATQDRMGWRALRLGQVADEVWVVCRDGRILTPAEWAEERRRTLQSIFSDVELQGLMNIYNKTLEDYRKFRELSLEEETYWRQLLTQTCLKTRYFQAEWLQSLAVKGVWHKHVEAAERQLQEVKNRVMGKVVELINAILSLSSPFAMKLDGNGEITVAVDWDVWQWLGWKDYPSKNPTAAAQYKILEENIQKELKIATRNIKPKRMENKNEIKSKVEFRQEIKQLQTMIDEMESMIQTLLEMNRNQQPTENAITH
jgi:hypothetical protein